MEITLEEKHTQTSLFLKSHIGFKLLLSLAKNFIKEFVTRFVKSC